MTEKSAQGLWFIAVTFFVGFYLAAIPFPGRFEIARPDWVGLLIIFWVLILPDRFGVLMSFCVGILYDILMGTTLGLYGLVFATLAYLVLLLHARLRMYPLGQQALAIFLILAVSHVLSLWLKGWLMSVSSGQLYIWPALASAFIWPWVYGLVRSFQIKLRVQ